jgi:hypothetical protein
MLSFEDLRNLHAIAKTASIKAGDAVPVAVLFQKTEAALKDMMTSQTLENVKAHLAAEAKALEQKQPAKTGE